LVITLVKLVLKKMSGKSESNIEDELYYYIGEDRVSKSEKHYQRGKCCKCNCLHCPYGTTIRNHGFKFEEVSSSRIDEAQAILGSLSKSKTSIFDQMIQSATGKNKKVVLNDSNKGQFKFVLLKGSVCGLLESKTKIHLKKYFKNQNIKLEDVLFSLEKLVDEH